MERVDGDIAPRHTFAWVSLREFVLFFFTSFSDYSPPLPSFLFVRWIFSLVCCFVWQNNGGVSRPVHKRRRKRGKTFKPCFFFFPSRLTRHIKANRWDNSKSLTIDCCNADKKKQKKTNRRNRYVKWLISLPIRLWTKYPPFHF